MPDLTTGLVGYWRFDEDAGAMSAADSSGLGNHGVLRGGASLGAPGYRGRAFSADGGSGLVTVPDSGSIADLAPLTLAFWVRPATIPSSANTPPRFVDKRVSEGWMVTLCHGDAGCAATFSWRQTFDGGSDGIWHAPDDVLQAGIWRHLAIVYDKRAAINQPSFYVDGVPVAAITIVPASGTAASDATMALSIGNSSQANRGFNGQLDEVRLYRRALAPSDISALYLLP